jgi:predicted N-formylglutamate amidohydrolase
MPFNRGMDRSSPMTRLLAADEAAPFTVEGIAGPSPFLLICDHAGRQIPRALGTLGLDERDLSRHIAWDIGARATSSKLAALLGATLIAQTYSRLVIDCNRPVGAPTSIAPRSERTDIPGNRDISAEEADLRAREVFAPYHARIATELDRRERDGRETILVSMHSFTPVFHDVARPWHLGMLYHRDARVAHALLRMIREEGEWTVGDNEPYSVSDATDYAIPVYGEGRGIAHVEIEIRQDLIADDDGAAAWAERLATWLRRLDRAALV